MLRVIRNDKTMLGERGSKAKNIEKDLCFKTGLSRHKISCTFREQQIVISGQNEFSLGAGMMDGPGWHMKHGSQYTPTAVISSWCCGKICFVPIVVYCWNNNEKCYVIYFHLFYEVCVLTTCDFYRLFIYCLFSYLNISFLIVLSFMYLKQLYF